MADVQRVLAEAPHVELASLDIRLFLDFIFEDVLEQWDLYDRVRSSVTPR